MKNVQRRYSSPWRTVPVTDESWTRRIPTDARIPATPAPAATSVRRTHTPAGHLSRAAWKAMGTSAITNAVVMNS